MDFRLYRILTEKLKTRPSAFRAAEPERLKEWSAEVEFEARRRRSLTALGLMAERKERERLAALPWWRRWLSRLARNPRRAARNAKNRGPA